MPTPVLLLLSTLTGVIAGYLANWAAADLPDRFRQSGAPASATLNRSAWRSKAVIVMLAILFPLLAWRIGWSPASLLVNWCYAWFLTTVSVIDLETRRVLNVMLAPAAVFALCAGFWLGRPSLPSILGGGVVGFLLFWGLYVIGRLMYGPGALGFGDVKLAGVIGLMAGYPGVMQALLLGALLGGAGAIFLLATRRARWSSASAYAPYLAAGAMLALWAGTGSL